MTWSEPRLWSSGEALTPALLNQEIQANLQSVRNNFDWMIHCSLSANQSLTASAAYIPVSFTVNDWVVGSTALHATASGSKFLAPEPGYYRLTGTLVLNTATGTRAVAWQKNGSGANHLMSMSAISFAGIPREFYFDETVQMTTADYLELDAYYKQGTSATVIGGATGTRICWQFLGGAT